MVISQEQGQFEAKDLPPGQYSVQGVAGAPPERLVHQCQVTAGGSAKVGLALTNSAARCCRRPGRSGSRRRRSTTVALELPEGDGKALVAGEVHQLP